MKLEFSATLAYKEQTHRGDGKGWSPAKTIYRFEKRRMAKVSRRNGLVAIQEFEAA